MLTIIITLQVIFPTGGFGIATSSVRTEENNPQNPNRASVIMSSPGDTKEDRIERGAIKLAFYCFAIVNFAITISMYIGATHADPENVSPYSPNSASVFQKPSVARTNIQNINYGFYLALLSLGILSVHFNSALGISCYALAVALNFLLCMTQIPYFLFAWRFLLDLLQLYLALVFRTRVMNTFLPTHIYDPRNHLRIPEH